MRRFKSGVVALAATALILSGCGGGGGGGSDKEGSQFDEVYAQVEGLGAEEREAKLQELAKEESGSILFYTSMSEDMIQALAEDFRKKYDITVEVFRADAEGTRARTIEEASAGRLRADVYGTAGSDMVPLTSKYEGIFAPYKSPLTADLPADAVKPEWVGYRTNHFAVSWNTDQISPADAPKHWEDLADDKYEGKLVIDARGETLAMVLADYFKEKGWSDQQVEDWFMEFYSGNALVQGNTTKAELTAAGQYGVNSSSYTYIVQSLMDDGAPLEYQPIVQPLFSFLAGVGLLKSSQNPASALLFTDWMITDAQARMTEFYQDPVNPKYAKKTAVADAEKVIIDDERALVETPEWTTHIEKYKQGAKSEDPPTK